MFQKTGLRTSKRKEITTEFQLSMRRVNLNLLTQLSSFKKARRVPTKINGRGSII
jgi:hypothetical protein